MSGTGGPRRQFRLPRFAARAAGPAGSASAVGSPASTTASTPATWPDATSPAANSAPVSDPTSTYGRTSAVMASTWVVVSAGSATGSATACTRYASPAIRRPNRSYRSGPSPRPGITISVPRGATPFGSLQFAAVARSVVTVISDRRED